MFKKAAPQIVETQITHKGQVIPLKIITSKRKSFSVAVYPNQDVIVKAPLRMNINSLLSKVELKADWIVKQRERFKDSPAKLPPKKYQEGEVFGFLGKQYTLKLVKSNQPKVELDGDVLLVKTKTISPTSVKTTLKFWYQEQATKLFAERLDFYAEQLAPLRLPKYSKLVIKNMKRRWGSCARDRVITLNPELIAAPLECVDYVIIHELCHLRELNHSPRYYKLLVQALPDWKLLKKQLNMTVGIGFL
jgi:predicted metal-dependent hydrolase